MSTEILGPVWKIMLPSTPKFVLVSLADQANDDGVCWPGVGSICKRTGFSERAVQQSLKHLEAWGYVKRVERPGRSTYYTVTPEAGAPPKDVHPASDAPTPAGRALTPAPDAPTPAPRAPITINEPSLNRQGTGAGAARPADPLFETLAEVCGLDWKNLTKLERGRLNVAARDLREIGATPHDVRDRAAAYIKLWPKVSLTPTALAANWGQCVAKPPGASSGAPAAPKTQLDNDLETADYEAKRLNLALRGADEDPQAYVSRVNNAVSDAFLAQHRRTA